MQAFTRSETAVLRQWISMLPIDVSPIDPSLPMATTRDPLPSSAAIDGKQLDRYWDFVYGANRIRDTQNIQLQPLQPVDLTERFQTMSSWSDWLASAPQTFKTILQSPNAIRFWRSDIDTIPFLRSLVCEPLPSFPTAADLVHHISTIDIPSITTLNCLQAIWYTSIAPLEWIPSSSPSKLASPLGMAIVKVLRCIHGFSEGDLGEGSDPGCLGADDVHVMLDGIWEIGPDIFTQHSDGTTLSRFTSGTGRELALPTLILALNSRPARSVPILLGMALALNICLHDMPCVRATLLKKPTARQRLSEITGRSRQWLVTAIDIGLEATTTKKPVVGWDGEGDWAEGVALGVALGVRGVRTACV